MNRFFLLICFLPILSVAVGQVITGTLPFKSTGSCGIQKTINTSNGLIVSLSYRGMLNIEDRSFESSGSASLLLLAFDEDQKLKWALEAGSRSEDQAVDLLYDPLYEVLYWTGMFWDELSIGSETYEISVGSRAIFLTAIDANNGELTWVQIVEGSAQKQVTSLAMNDSGDVLLSGFFGGNLILPDQSILETTSIATLFAYLTDVDGNVLFGKKLGGMADLRPRGSVSDGVSFYIAGTIRGEGAFENDTITGRIADTDAFLIKIESNGSNPWAKLAGGVYDKNVTGLIWQHDRLVLYGYFMGQMRISSNLLIQTNGLNIDGYLIAYSGEGEGLFATTIPGSGNIYVSQLSMKEDHFMLCGTWDGNIRHPAGNSIEAPFGTQQGFVIRLTDAFEVLEFIHIESEGLLSDVAFYNLVSGKDLLQLNFGSAISLWEERFESGGGFEGLLIFLDVLSSSNEVDEISENPLIFPNPAWDWIQCPVCRDARFVIYNMDGVVMLQGSRSDQVSISHLPPAMYLIVVEQFNNDRGFMRFIKR